jgi:hypothetical protein
VPSNAVRPENSKYYGSGVGGGGDGDDDDDTADPADAAQRERVVRRKPILYRDRSDTNCPCFEFARIGPFEYFVRKVGSSRSFILAHESSEVVKFCFRIERMQQTESDRILAAKVRERPGLDDQHTPVPGVVGWFVANVMGQQPVFAFERANGTDDVTDARGETPSVPNRAIPSDKVTRDAGLEEEMAFLDNGHLYTRRMQDLIEVAHGRMPRASLQSTGREDVHENLSVFGHSGDTASGMPFGDYVPTSRRFSTVSPIESLPGRWYVVTAPYWCLFVAAQQADMASMTALSTLKTRLDSYPPTSRIISLASNEKIAYSTETERDVLSRFLAANDRELRQSSQLVVNRLEIERVAAQLSDMRERLRELQLAERAYVMIQASKLPEDKQILAETVSLLDRLAELTTRK